MLGRRPPIPESIKREVRQKCGFGCVVCGLGYYDYHHLVPYRVTKSHNADELILLCAFHHTEFERGRLSERKLIESSKNPIALQRGYALGVYESSDQPLTVELGNSVFKDVPTIIQVGAVPILGFRRPEYADEPWLLTAFMADYSGNPMLTIRDNEWRANTNRWDIVTEGPTLTIKNNARNIGLKITQVPGEKLIFERAKIRFAGINLELKSDGLYIGDNRFSECHVSNCSVGFGFDVPDYAERALTTWTKTVGSSYGFKDNDDSSNLRLITYE